MEASSHYVNMQLTTVTQSLFFLGSNDAIREHIYMSRKYLYHHNVGIQTGMPYGIFLANFRRLGNR